MSDPALGAPPPSVRPLGSRVARGAAVTVAGSLLVRGAGLLVLLVVARVLSPDAYGAVSLALVIFGVSESLTEPGLTAALIREPGLDDRTVNVAWTLSLVRGVLLTAAFYAAAPLLAEVFGGTEAVVRYLRLLAIAFVLKGLVNLHLVRVRRALRYGTAFLIDHAGPLAGSILGLALLLTWRDPLALVVGPLAGWTVATLVSFIWIRPMPALRWDGGDARRLWRFGRFMALHGIFVYVLLNVDDLFVARVDGMEALGIYALAYRVVNGVAMYAVQTLNSVLMPAYARLQTDLERLGGAVLDTVGVLIGGTGMLAAVILVFTADLFLVFGATGEWGGVVGVGRALLPFVLVRGMNAALSPAFLARGSTGALAAVSGTQLALALPALWLGHRLAGVVGVAGAVSALNVVAGVGMVLAARRVLGLSPRRLLGAVAVPVGTAAIAAAAAWPLTSMLVPGMLRLVLGGMVVCGVFLLVWEMSSRGGGALGPPRRSLVGIATEALR